MFGSKRTLQSVAVVILAVTTISAGAVFYSTSAVGQAANSSAHAQVDVDPSDLPGEGSDSNPFEISNVSELQAMEDDLDANYQLVSDIDASNTTQWNDGAGFDPIGDGSGDFKGNFNGNDHNITQLVINRGSSGEEVGLFGEVDDAVIESVHLASATITGNRSVGAVAGLLEPGTTVRHVSVNGTVSGEKQNVGVLIGAIENSSVSASSARGSVTGPNDVGGLAGQNVGGVITQSVSQASVTAIGDFGKAGGLAGGNYNNGIINKSYATGTVSGGKAGGLIGSNYNGSRIANVYAVGSVDGRIDRGTGGLVGENISSCPYQTTNPQCKNFETTTVADSYWDKQATGQATSAGGVGLTNVEMQGTAAQTNMTGLDFEDTWQTVDGDYPELVALSNSDRSEDSESVSRFDTNGEAGIQQDEIINAIVAFNANGTIEGEPVTQKNVIDLIVEYNT